MKMPVKKPPTPKELKEILPLDTKQELFLQKARVMSQKLLSSKRDKIVAIAGPCSIHEKEGTLEYAHKLKELSARLKNIHVIMRFFIEKPRTHLGWKGFVYDPDLDGTYDLIKGLEESRKLLLELADIQMPCATEFLSPLLVPYFEDLIVWGFVGARTSSSQIHRQMASRFDFPVGFKNSIDGNIEIALDGAKVASIGHTFLDIDESGKINSFSSQGNPYTHVVLRGSANSPNFNSIEETLSLMYRKKFTTPILVDCSHGNSQAQEKEQKAPFKATIEKIQNGQKGIVGVMLESYLKEGKQSLKKPSELIYGCSVTDSCLDFDSTEELLVWADAALSDSSSS